MYMSGIPKTIKKLKKQILEISYNSQEGHIPSSFSVLDILYILYNNVLNIDPKDLNNPNRDIFILSKAHASLGLYTILAEKGFLNESELKSFCKFNSNLGGHPDKNKINGIEASTGSLGHGFPIAVGIALASKIQNKNNRIFCLVGDGELNEGSIWESILLASQHKLDNLCLIIDYNHSTDKFIRFEDLSTKLYAHNWVAQTINGHNHKDIYNALNFKIINKPVAIIANTIKGFGCNTLENNPAWHHRSPINQEELNILLEELNCENNL